MKRFSRAPSPGDDAFVVEQRLRRRAAQNLAQVDDLELFGVLAHVSARRRARAWRVVDAALESSRGSRTAAQGTAHRAERTVDAHGALIDVQRVAENVRILRIARPSGFTFEPGQHVKLGVADGGRNPYTIGSAPDEAHLEFCIERAASGGISAKLFGLRPGDRIAMDPKAKGSFTLVANARVHLMVATVTGISPFRSMLRHAELRKAWAGQFIVLHGASFADELAYREELEGLAARFPGRFRYLPSVSRPADPRNFGFQGASGRVSELIMNVVVELGRTPGVQVYACGHPQMVATVRRQMEALDLPVSTEVFD